MRISKITNMVPLLMELGGKDAAIVLKDADLKLAAKNINVLNCWARPM